MQLCYIAGPYRSNTLYGTLENIRAAEKVALKYWNLGYAVICPHKNTSFFDGALQLPNSTWLKGDLEMLKRCDAIVMMKNWRKSKGAMVEHNFVLRKRIKIIYE